MDDDDRQRAELLLRILGPLYRHGNLKKLSNKELSLRLICEVWGEMGLGSREEALIFEVINRLQSDDKA